MAEAFFRLIPINKKLLKSSKVRKWLREMEKKIMDEITKKEGYMGMVLDSGLDMIRKERENQIVFEGFSAEHDDKNVNEELAQAAAYYALPEGREPAPFFPETWDPKWNKKGKHSRIRQLAIAGALCAAEIDRLRRKGEK